MTTETLPKSARRLVEWVRGRQCGSLRVVDVTAKLDADSTGETALFLNVVLPPPDDDAGTWPLDDMLALYAAVNERARKLELEWFCHVRLYPPDDYDDFGVDEDDDE